MSTVAAAPFVAPTVVPGDTVLFNSERLRDEVDRQHPWLPALVEGVGQGGRLAILVLAGYGRGARDGVCHMDDPALDDPRLGPGLLEDSGGIWRVGPHIEFREEMRDAIYRLTKRINELDERLKGFKSKTQ